MKPHTGGTPNGISERDYARLGCGVYRSADGMLIALHEPTDGQMRQAIADGAWLLVIQRDKERFIQRAGRLKQPHVGELITIAQAYNEELTTWHRSLGGDYAHRNRNRWYDDDVLPSLADLAAEMDAAWTRRAELAIRDLFRRYTREAVADGARIPAWMRRGWDAAQSLSLLEEIYAEEAPVS